VSLVQESTVAQWAVITVETI